MGTFLPKPIIVDIDKTFGKLKFQRVKFEVFEKDAEGNDTEVVKTTHFDVKSYAQNGFVPVKVKGKLPKSLKFGSRVELVNPVIEPYAIPQEGSNRINSGISVTVTAVKEISPK